MITMMHYAGTAVLEAHGPTDTRRAVAAVESHLTTLAFSEAGSRSRFWTPVVDGRLHQRPLARLDAAKSWVTSADDADSYVWSSRPMAADGPMTLWLVPLRPHQAASRCRGDLMGWASEATRRRP
jgi:isovaleryl-CoA dehydrogenase